MAYQSTNNKPLHTLRIAAILLRYSRLTQTKHIMDIRL